MEKIALCLIALFILLYFLTTKWLGFKLSTYSLPISLFLLAFWSIFGSIPIILAESRNERGPRFQVEVDLFEINLDVNFYIAVVSYVVFLATVLLILILFQRTAFASDARFDLISLSKFSNHFPHFLLLSINLVLLIAVVIETSQIETMAGSQPVYLSQNRLPDRFFLYLELGILLSTTIGSLFYCAMDENKFKYPKILATLYLVIFALACYPFWISGGRSSIFIALCALLVGVATFSSASHSSFSENIRRCALPLILCVVAASFISVTSTTRGEALIPSIAAPEVSAPEVSAPEVSAPEVSAPEVSAPEVSAPEVSAPEVSAPEVSISSNVNYKLSAFLSALSKPSSYLDWTGRGEMLYSFVSLYGVLSYSQEEPKLLFKNTYNRYVESLNVVSNQGFTIHPVTALWMNIGIFAPIITGIYFGLILCFFFVLSRKKSTGLWPALSVSSLTVASASIPILLVRGGPEAIWGLLLHVVILPFIFLAPSVYVGNRRLGSKNPLDHT
jgi:hypothetical protein